MSEREEKSALRRKRAAQELEESEAAEVAADKSFESCSNASVPPTHQTCGESIRSQLWKGLDKKTEDVLVNYLSHHDVGDEDPILVVECLPHLETLQGNAANGANKAIVQAALAAVAQDIGQLGSVFLFNSHEDLQRTKDQLEDVTFLGNVAWAYYYSPIRCAKMLADFGFHIPPAKRIPTINTRMITFYSLATARLAHDQFNFFMS